MSALTFEPLISPALWVMLAALAAGLLAWYGWHRPSAVPLRRWGTILALMACGIAAVLAILLNPTWLEPIPPPAGKPLLTVLVDRSASMATRDHGGEQERYERAVQIAREVASDLSRRFEVRVRTFAESSRADDADQLASQQPDGELTDLAAAIAGSLEADRPQGQALLVLSDGAHNAPGGIETLLGTVRAARAMSAPIYAMTLGGDTIRRDLEVSVARPQELSFVGQRVPIAVVLRQRGAVTDRADVVLLEEGREIDRRTIDLQVDGITRVELPVRRDASGLFRYEVQVEPRSTEATAANNSATVLVRLIDEPLRVLLLEGKPYWDAKFLIRTLGSDPSLELDSIVRLASQRFIRRRLSLQKSAVNEEAGEPMPGSAAEAIQRVEETEVLSDPARVLSDPEALAGYQVIVLGRDAEVFLDEGTLERLRTWISRDGGALVLYRGSPVAQVNQQLARLLPVRWSAGRESRYRVNPTERGESLGWLGSPQPEGGDVLHRLPSLATLAVPEQPKPLAIVLATTDAAQGPPVVTYQPYGTGRVVAIEGAGMWRWAFLPPEHQDLDATYTYLWQSLIRWLVSSAGLTPGQDMLLRTDKITWTAGEPVSAVLLVREETRQQELPQVELAGPDGSRESATPVPLGDEPGVYRVPFGRLAEGQYEARIAGRQDAGSMAAFDVRRSYAEQLDVRARPDLMARIAQESGGEVIDAGSPLGVAEQFREHLARSRPERVRRLTAWDHWWVLMGVFAVWGTAWGLRRSAGLI